MANYQPCGAVLNIVSSSKAATLLACLTKLMIQYHSQKLNQVGKATHSLVPLPVTMTLNYSQSLAGHTSSIFTPDKKSKLKHPTHEMQERLTHPKQGKEPCWICYCKRWYAFLVWLVSKSWDEYFAHFATNQKAVAEWGWGSMNYSFFFHPEIQLKNPESANRSKQ